MNSSKRGAVYGFKLQSLDLVRKWWVAWAGSLGTVVVEPVFSYLALPLPPFQLLDTKSTDRKMTLLHFIALTVKEKYPDLTNFWHELHFVEKAAAGEASLSG